MGSVSVIRDGVGIARMGHPTAPYPSLGSQLSHPSTQVARWSFLDGDPIGGPFQTLPGMAEGHLHAVAPYFLCSGCDSGGPYLGHIPFLPGDVSLGRAYPIS